MDKVWKFLGFKGETSSAKKRGSKSQLEPQAESKNITEDRHGDDAVEKMVKNYQNNEELKKQKNEDIDRVAKKMAEMDTSEDKIEDSALPPEAPSLDSKVKADINNPQVDLVVVSDALPGQKVNEAGGYSFEVKDLDRLKRFIVLGTEGNTYYATEKERFNQNIACVKELLDDGHVDILLDTLEQYSCQGRVAKEDAILAALMTCVLYSNETVQKKAYARIVKICNIPTKLFKFIEFCQGNINKQRETIGSEEKQIERQLKKRPRDKDAKNEPSESTDKSLEPKKKKKKEIKKEIKKSDKFKAFNVKPMRSSGWGRMRRNGIGAFYTDDNKDANRLLYLVTKYKSRNNWSHKQVLGYSHPKISANDDNVLAKNLVLTYCTRGYPGFKKRLAKEKENNPNGLDPMVSQIEAHVILLEKVAALKPDNEEDINILCADLKNYGIRDIPEDFTTAFAFPGGKHSELKKNVKEKRVPFQLVREHIPTGFLKIGRVWEALLQDMPMTALLRNLGKLTSFQLFDKPENLQIVVDAFGNVERLKRSRIHPVKILIALKAYEEGKSGPVDPPRFMWHRNEKENKRPKPENPTLWRPNPAINKALDKAFYDSFKQPELKDGFKTNKKFMLALDVSGSMTFQGCFGCEQITPAIAATALSMVTWNIEEHVEMVAFGGHLESLTKYGLRKDMDLKQAMSTMRKVNFGSTDCSLPIVYAKDNNIDVDVFIVYTDSDTGHGRIDPSTALKNYRKTMNPDAKLIVMGMTSNGFSIADPKDKGMLDIVGFDTGVPEMISEFVQQKVEE